MAAIFVALKTTTLINLLFQRTWADVETFQIGELELTLIENLDRLDVCRYFVRLGEQNYWLTFVGTDCAVDCGTLSNVDFVHFMWRNIRGDLRRHAITILPDPNSGALQCLSAAL